MVHCHNGFGFGQIESENIWTSRFQYFIFLFLNQKCAIAFNLLFGVSFYLMLRNPRNSSSKFVWRCFLLMLIGILNKLFYTYDALMWYGLWGMVLVLFRNMKTSTLALIGVLLFSINASFMHIFDIKAFIDLSFDQRYYDGVSLTQILQYPLPNAIGDYFYAVRTSPFGGLSLMLMGYSIGKSGIIEQLENKMHLPLLITAWGFTLGLQFITTKYLPLLAPYQRLIASVTYSYTVLFIYYRTPLHNYLSYLASYGKLGLTNYSMQGVVMITLISSSGLNLAEEGAATTLYICGGVLFICQAIFSHYWLKRYMYGPYEWVWRCCTQLKWLPLRRPRPVAETA